MNYPTALPLLPCYRDRQFEPSDFPNAVGNQEKILSLPMFPEISSEQIQYVCFV
ncbi:erythromycin biosynthesis sensory transduction protein eryC1, partial [bacterium]|nr:erythromycin biosynthesis sensory transduction protein eryC1 [bacterium]